MPDRSTRPASSGGAVLITGAAGGVGLATARALSQRGYHVYAGTHSGPGELAHLTTVTVVPLDVTDGQSVAAAAARLNELGVTRLDAVVNNAGVIVQGPLELLPDEVFARQFAVNVFGPFLVTKTFLPFLRRGEGRLVNVTGGAARLAGPFFAPISASKAALASLSDALRLELAHMGISVVTIEPGALATGIWAKAAAEAERDRSSASSEVARLYDRQVEAVGAAGARQKPSPPSLVAEAIVKAVTSRRPKARYTVGSDLRLLGFASRLPLRTRDRLVRRVMGLSKAVAAP